jgi:hypothetical protein
MTSSTTPLRHFYADPDSHPHLAEMDQAGRFALPCQGRAM